MPASRIYVVLDTSANKQYLVRASTPSGAIRAITSPQFSAGLADQDTLIKLVGEGAKVIEAKDDGDATPAKN